MFFLLYIASLFITYVSSVPVPVPGYDLHGLDYYSPPLIKAPLLHAPIIEHAPLIHPAPIIKAPILAHPPIIKTIAPLPIVKTIIPATSYASVTSYAISHPIKTIIAAPPVLKYAAPLPISLGHGYGYH